MRDRLFDDTHTFFGQTFLNMPAVYLSTPPVNMMGFTHPVFPIRQTQSERAGKTLITGSPILYPVIPMHRACLDFNLQR